MNLEAFYKVTYGLYLVSSASESGKSGYISNTVFQVSAEPPKFAIACSKNNYTAEIITQSMSFGVSALKRDCRPELIGTFGYRTGREVDKFKGYSVITGESGSPIVLDDSVAWFDCRVEQRIDTGTHILFIAAVIACEINDPAAEVLTYAYYREVKKGKAPKNAPTYLDTEKLKAAATAKTAALYYCTACGYVYDPKVGDPAGGIPPGTAFENLPQDWVCPICGTPKSEFIVKD